METGGPVRDGRFWERCIHGRGNDEEQHLRIYFQEEERIKG